MNFRFMSYPLDDLAQNALIREPEFQMSSAAKRTAYPLRAIRYWWVAQALARELNRKPQATIVDMGAGHGQMRRYCAGLPLRLPAVDWIGQTSPGGNLRRWVRAGGGM